MKRQQRTSKDLWKDPTEKKVFTQANIIVEPKKETGRPRLYPIGTPKGLKYLFKKQVKCRNRFCPHYRILPVRPKSICCSKSCEVELRRQCEIMLSILDGRMPVADLPPDLRTWRRDPVRSAKVAKATKIARAA